MKKLLSLALVLVMMLTLVACPPQPPQPPVGGGSDVFDLDYAEGTVLRMATGYNSAKTGLFFDAETAGKGVTLADGVTYHTGDLKPTWVEVEKVLKVEFEDKYQGKKASDEWKYWEAQLGEVDMVSGTASQLSEAGTAGKLVNIAAYLEHMPNFRAYLEANPIVRLSITGDTTTGAIYFSPYFDGVDDIERMPLMRVDWVVKLLNGEGEFTASESGTLAAPVYTPYMPTSGKVTVDAVNAEGTAVIQLTKDYDKAGNIIEKMNAAGTLTGVQAVNMLRKYIDEAYNGYYGTNRADLFIGQNAAWDADELVALLRCVVANPKALTGNDTVQGLFSREDNNTQRKVDLFRFAGSLFGVRGLESRQDYLYIGADGKMHDARQEAETYVAIERMNALMQEGLISSSYRNNEAESSGTMLEKDLGFMSYDYNQTQTILNATKLQADNGEKYMAVMVPVARWNDGTGEIFMRFTESWRSVKTDGWGISLAGVEGNDDKLHAALALIDYAYSKEGQILLSYGPAAFVSNETFIFNGQEWPVISEESHKDLWELASGNYTNYARQYIGSTLSFVKSQSFEYQCTHEVGKEGAGKISVAIGLGTIKHPKLEITENPWWTSVPTVLPTTKVENAAIAELTELTDSGKFSQSKGKTNYLINIISGGYDAIGADGNNAAELIDTVTNTFGGNIYLLYKNAAWSRLQSYYANITK